MIPAGTSRTSRARVPQLRALARKLADIYGEHRILFDEFAPAKDLFVIDDGTNQGLWPLTASVNSI